MIRVLFVCVHNSARSQMAEGLARQLGVGCLEVLSAGSQPTSVHPFVDKVMEEAGIDISSQYSKSFADIADQRFDYVITLCGEGEVTCPVFPGVYERLYWPLFDPVATAGAVQDKLASFRAVRDELSESIKEFIVARCP